MGLYPPRHSAELRRAILLYLYSCNGPVATKAIIKHTSQSKCVIDYNLRYLAQARLINHIAQGQWCAIHSFK